MLICYRAYSGGGLVGEQDAYGFGTLLAAKSAKPHKTEITIRKRLHRRSEILKPRKETFLYSRITIKWGFTHACI